jgi:integrase
MTIYKRASTWWTDFTVNERRYRVPLKTSDRREALRLEKLKISQAQGGGLLPGKVAKLTIIEAAELYLRRRESEVSASTVRLETDALKQVKRHLGETHLGQLTLDSLGTYIQKRKGERIGNRTINIEVGVLRRILKRYKLWHIVGEDYHPLVEPKDIGRALTATQELNLFTTAASRTEWQVAFWVSLLTANTSAAGCELRNLKLADVDLETRTMLVKVGKNRFRVRMIPLNRTALWAVEQLLARARQLGATNPDHYLIPRRVSGKQYDPAQPPSRWAWRTAWRKLTEACGLSGLRPHDLRHHAITRMAESAEASEQTIMSIAGHVSREMLEHYSHIRQSAKRKAVEGLDHVTITAQLPKWKAEADARTKAELTKKKGRTMVGMGRFELPTPRTPSECSTRLSHIPTVTAQTRRRGKLILALRTSLRSGKRGHRGPRHAF